MEPHGSPRLLLVLLCLAISIAGVRSRIGVQSRIILDVSPNPEPAAAGLVPDVAPSPEPRLAPHVSPTPGEPAAAELAPDDSSSPECAADQLTPSDSPTQEPVADELALEISPTPREPAASPSPLRSIDFSLEGIGSVLANSPDQSAAAEDAAVLVEDLTAPDQSAADDEEAVLVEELAAPDQSAAAEDAAVLVEELELPSAKEMVDGIDVPAALNSVDENTLETLQSLM